MKHIDEKIETLFAQPYAKIYGVTTYRHSHRYGPIYHLQHGSVSIVIFHSQPWLTYPQPDMFCKKIPKIHPTNQHIPKLPSSSRHRSSKILNWYVPYGMYVHRFLFGSTIKFLTSRQRHGNVTATSRQRHGNVMATSRQRHGNITTRAHAFQNKTYVHTYHTVRINPGSCRW